MTKEAAFLGAGRVRTQADRMLGRGKDVAEVYRMLGVVRAQLRSAEEPVRRVEGWRRQNGSGTCSGRTDPNGCWLTRS